MAAIDGGSVRDDVVVHATVPANEGLLLGDRPGPDARPQGYGPGVRLRSALLGIALLVGVTAPSSAGAQSTPGLGNNDPHCNGGRGFHYTSPWYSVEGLGVAVTSRGVTLIDYTSSHPSTENPLGDYTILAVSRGCTLDRNFGTDGILRPRLPDSSLCSGFGVGGSVVPSSHGGFFVLASGAHDSWLGEFNARGGLVRRFGHGGWAHLPERPGLFGDKSISDAYQAPSGLIYVGGNQGASHATNRIFVMALRPDGRLDTGFGTDGVVHVLPMMTEGGGLLVQPDGSIAVVGWLGGGGCGDDQIAWLTPSGRHERAIDATYDRGGTFPLTSCFWGDEFLDAAGGVGAVGVVTSLPGVRGSGTADSAIEGLSPNAQLDPDFGSAGMTRFSTPSRSSWQNAAASLGNGDIAYASTGSRYVYLQAFSPSGHLYRDFGRWGHTRLKCIATTPNYTSLCTSSGVVAGPRPNDATIALGVGRRIALFELIA